MEGTVSSIVVCLPKLVRLNLLSVEERSAIQLVLLAIVVKRHPQTREVLDRRVHLAEVDGGDSLILLWKTVASAQLLLKYVQVIEV